MFSVGQLIRQLEKCESDKLVYFDFCHCVPTHVGSWRGIYDEPALGWEASGYSGNGKHIKVGELISRLKDSLTNEFTAWKGGEYSYVESDRLHVDNSGDCTYTGIEMVENGSYSVIIHTRYEE